MAFPVMVVGSLRERKETVERCCDILFLICVLQNGLKQLCYLFPI